MYKEPFRAVHTWKYIERMGLGSLCYTKALFGNDMESPCSLLSYMEWSNMEVLPNTSDNYTHLFI
jgi:hypothetical protein